MSVNRSLWQDKAGQQGIIRESPIPSEVADGQIMIRVHTWALNPADHMIQDIPLPFVTYPLILGEDVAGTVELVGSAASSKFKTGDRITGLALGAATFEPEHGAFQDYVVLDHAMACRIPDSLSFNEASVFPLCVATAAYGLFSKDFLDLPYPKVDSTSTGKSILIWGGSSGVGSNAIQLSKSAGFEVITTCSARNFDYVKSLGADKVFDYNSSSVIDDLAAELDKGVCVGIYHAASDTASSCQVALKSKQGLLIASATLGPEPTIPEGVQAKWIIGDATVIHREVLPATFGGFLPDALARGRYKVAPAPETVPTNGVEGIQEGLNILRKGVSARKIVVEAS